MVEHNLAKVGVASSNLVSRSNLTAEKTSVGSAGVFSIHEAESGWVAEWLCSGLQIRVPRFDSGPSLQLTSTWLVPILSQQSARTTGTYEDA